MGAKICLLREKRKAYDGHKFVGYKHTLISRLYKHANGQFAPFPVFPTLKLFVKLKKISILKNFFK